MDPLEFVYKRVDTLDLKLDVYLPADASENEPAPICIWWHGGGRKSHLSSSIVKELIYQYFRQVQSALCFE
jgi:dipeptidyl aminopeptidase/acylaminoacyl peptidase